MGSSASGVSIGNIRGFNDSSSVMFDNPASLDNTALGLSSFYATFMQGDIVDLGKVRQSPAFGLGLELEPLFKESVAQKKASPVLL